jgi:hypothetical protein
MSGLPGGAVTFLFGDMEGSHWSRRVGGRFPDGQLYVNLRGYDAEGAAVTPRR